MKKIFIFHTDGQYVDEVAKEVSQYAKKKGFEILARENLSKFKKGDDIVLLSLGGDGTFLKASQIALSIGASVFGINLGNLGFLTDVEGIDIFAAIDALDSGSYFIEERTTIKCEALSEEVEKEFYAVNDFVILRNINNKILQLELIVNDLTAGKFRADGFVISSPTGSTAYSLSAGGPIVTPHADVFILSFLAPHKLSARPVVFSNLDKVSTKILSDGEFSFQRDGEEVLILKKYDRLHFEKNSTNLRIVHLKSKNFFEVLNKKFGWGA